MRSVQDSQLLDDARRGDNDAITRLMTDLLPFIHKKAFACASVSGLDAEDLAQEGLIGFLGAVRTFKKDSGAQFSTYACACILNGMRTAMRRTAKAGAVPAAAMVPMNDANEWNLAQPDPQDIIAEREEADGLWRIVEKRLSEREQQVLRLYIGGDSYAAIARKLSLRDAKSVDNTLQRIRKKLKSFS